MKLGIIGYIPPDHGYPHSFLKNMRQFRTSSQLYLYSDAPDMFGLDMRIQKPGEAVMYRNVPLSLNNFVFLKGIEVALKNELDYFIYLEEDVRVRGDFWDERLFTEFFAHKDCVVGGTPSIWNMGLCGAEAAIAAVRFSNRVIKTTGRPPLFWGGGGRYGGPMGLWVYPNGAGAIFHTATVKAIFNGYQSDIGTFCANLQAWDVHAGKGMWNQFKLESFDRIAVLKSEYSGFRDCAYSLHERKKMLTDGDVVLIHQIKEDWVPE